MARGSGSSGSYRDWEAERRRQVRAAEQARQKRERELKAQEQQRLQAEATARDAEAAARTRQLEARVEELETILRSSLRRDPQIRLASLRRRLQVPPLDLGPLAHPEPAPVWKAPAPPGWLQRAFGDAQRYETALRQAEADFAKAQADHRHRETQRQKKVIDRRRAHQQQVVEAERAVAEENARLDAIEVGLGSGDRHAVSNYMDLVLQTSPYPEGFPAERRTGYVPESSLLAVEWYLPAPEIVPEHKLYKHIKTRKTVEPTPRSIPETRQIYQRVIAQIALRTLREVFDADPGKLITTIVFNGRVRTVDPVTGQQIEPYLITMRATREQFSALVLNEPRFKPVECVRRHFHADVSPHPEELEAVEPVMPFSMADPRIVDPVDIISDIDKRPNLLELHHKEFEAFIQNLFTKMGFDTKLYQASGDGGVDCVAYDARPVASAKIIVQAKLYTKTVQPTHVRDLYGTVQHEGATKGIMITTSGYGPDSYKFASGKPLELIDGAGLLALCHEHNIPARILNRGKKRP
ncbi:restriction endonuclease [Nonomuraea sp. NPDC049709]|uniref:restriction endonuclease n=1 Tax=Nonomuraea sp. NPDC049709 TaxID=3154736 RepID=UPI0034130D9D